MAGLLALAVAAQYNVLFAVEYIPNPKISPDEVGLNDPNVDVTLVNIFNTVYFMAGAIAVLVMVVAGLMYMTANGDPGKTKNARNMIAGAAAGLVFVAMAAAITAFVTSKIG